MERRALLFWGGLALKVACLFAFGSQFLRELFVPFLDTAVQHPLQNPWTLSPPQSFPYGSVLYGLLAAPRWLAHLIFGQAALGTGSLGIALVKAPMLFLDLLTFWTLSRLARERASNLIVYYWLNPIAFYVIYIHGQLDIAATSLCLLSLYLVTRRKHGASALMLAAATLCTFHVVAVVPLVIAYIWNRDFARDAARRIGKWLAIWAAASAVGFIPLVLAGRFLYASTSSPEVARLFAAKLDFGPGHTLYLGVLLVVATLGRVCLATRITERGLIFGAGAVFGALVVGTSAMPGWYLWFVPFLALLFSLYVNLPRVLFWAINGLYLLYMVVLVDSQQLGAPPRASDLAVDMGFTLLQTAVAAGLFSLWRLALRFESPLLRRTKPLMLGLAGDSGAGKDHFSLLLSDVFNRRNTLLVEGDDYHKWERGHERWENYTHLNPRANHLLPMAQHAVQLAQGLPIFQQQYDHGSGRFTSPRELKPSRTVIVQGLHTLYLRQMRDDFDLKIFLAPDPLIRLAWKLKRDVEERGHSREKVLASMEEREADARLHIEPQRQFADWIVEVAPRDATTREEILEGRMPGLAVRHWLWNDAPVSELVEGLAQEPSCEVKMQLVPEDVNRVVVWVSGTLSPEQVGRVAKRVFPNLRHLTRGRMAPAWHADLDGFNQLMAIALLRGSARA